MVMMVGSSRGSRRAAMAVVAAATAVRVGSLVNSGTVMMVGLTSSRIAAAAADSTATGTSTSTSAGRVRWHLLIRPRLVVMVLMMLMIVLTCSTAATTIRRGDAHLLGPVGNLVGEGRRRFA